MFMNLFTPDEILQNYAEIGAKKASGTAKRLMIMGLLAGFLVGIASAGANMASHSVENASAARTISGLLFPFGLGIIMLIGAELFTGNTMIAISVWEKKTSVKKMLRNWALVYSGNFIGSALLAAACVYCGHLNYSNGALALYTIKIAAYKCSLDFGPAVVMGILCNLLVCLGVLCSLSAKDAAGRVIGAYMPVVFFVLCAFEHSVANMYYIPAGIFAAQNPVYAQKALEAGINISNLTWGGFIVRNLVPVTIGNIIGGVMLAYALWTCNRKQRQAP